MWRQLCRFSWILEFFPLVIAYCWNPAILCMYMSGVWYSRRQSAISVISYVSLERQSRIHIMALLLPQWVTDVPFVATNPLGHLASSLLVLLPTLLCFCFSFVSFFPCTFSTSEPSPAPKNCFCSAVPVNQINPRDL